MAERRIRTKGRTAPSGRVTPKATPSPSGRYTPPIPRDQKVSPRWVPVLILTLLLLGALVIVTNYLGLLPVPTGHGFKFRASNWYLLLGLGLITSGFITATTWR
ncbi:MAG TPA: cell division protein CrgA [Acidimicrobiales bacterium]